MQEDSREGRKHSRSPWGQSLLLPNLLPLLPSTRGSVPRRGLDMSMARGECWPEAGGTESDGFVGWYQTYE